MDSDGKTEGDDLYLDAISNLTRLKSVRECSWRGEPEMAYEIFTKMTRVASEPKVSIGKKLGRMQFNASAAKILRDMAVDYALLMYDKENRMIAVKGISKKDNRAYSLRFAKKGNGAGFAAKAFLHHIGYDLTQTRSFECQWNDEQNMFEFQVPGSAFKAIDMNPRSKLPNKNVRIESEARTHGRASL
jgi:hypothetical protein